MQVIDNFIEDTNQFKQIQSIITSNDFVWNTSDILSDNNSITNFQLVHNVIWQYGADYEGLNAISPLLDRLNPYLILRIKINLNTYVGSEIIEGGMHTDYESNIKDFKTAVFYINTNNGYTRFEDTNEKVYSVENRIVIFDGNRKHTGTNCTNAKGRFVININYIE
jgi:hypothetical protein